MEAAQALTVGRHPECGSRTRSNARRVRRHETNVPGFFLRHAAHVCQMRDNGRYHHHDAGRSPAIYFTGWRAQIPMNFYPSCGSIIARQSAISAALPGANSSCIGVASRWNGVPLTEDIRVPVLRHRRDIEQVGMPGSTSAAISGRATTLDRSAQRTSDLEQQLNFDIDSSSVSQRYGTFMPAVNQTPITIPLHFNVEPADSCWQAAGESRSVRRSAGGTHVWASFAQAASCLARSQLPPP